MVPSSFILYVHGACVILQSLLEPLSCMGLSIMPLLGVTISISVPCRQPDLGVQYHPWSKVDIRGQPPYLIQWLRPQEWAILELILGLGYSGSSLPPGGSLSSTNLLYGDDFVRSFCDKLGQSSDGVVSETLTARRC